MTFNHGGRDAIWVADVLAKGWIGLMFWLRAKGWRQYALSIGCSNCYR